MAAHQRKIRLPHLGRTITIEINDEQIEYIIGDWFELQAGLSSDNIKAIKQDGNKVFKCCLTANKR